MTYNSLKQNTNCTWTGTSSQPGFPYLHPRVYMYLCTDIWPPFPCHWTAYLILNYGIPWERYKSHGKCCFVQTHCMPRSMKQTVILAWGLFLKRKICCHTSQRLHGYTKPLHIISVNDKKRILSSLCDLHLFMKVKAAVHDGLALGGVLPFMKSNFGLLLWLLFVDETPPFTVGMLHFFFWRH